MIPGTAPPKEDFKSLLLTAWNSKIPLRRDPLHPQVLVRERDPSRVELGFLLSETADAHPLPLRFRYDRGRMELSRDDLAVEFGEWKRVPDIASANAEMDTFIADFECARGG